jgi:hypothetical protein
MRPRRTANDYLKGKLAQDELIATQIANDANIAQARKTYILKKYYNFVNILNYIYKLTT